ncbi:MAG: RluA family pseudouridine synthase [Alphaproteobacteria bacterium]|nr:RluA family pseudouridine synthase [Alphaproteobacteria bacterium]
MVNKTKRPLPLAGRGRGGGREGGNADRAVAPSSQGPSPPTPSPPGRGGLVLLHEDAHVLAFDKPSGLAVQGGSGVSESLEGMLAAFAKSNGKRPRLVHRLDRETSGVIVVARTKPAAAFLSQAFAERRVEKRYLAIVCGGAPAPPHGVIDLALRKTKRDGVDVMQVSPQGLVALTRYETVAATPHAALVSLDPETGRMHQLRVHLAAIGRPIAGDGKYGGLFSIAGNQTPRLLLHAAALRIPHPDGGERRFEAPAPEDFMRAAAALGLAG